MLTKIPSFVQSLLHRKYTLLVLLLILILIVVTALGLGYSRNSRQPGIYIAGPTSNIKLGTSYKYSVEVVSNKSYKNAIVSFSVPSSYTPYQTKTISLVAHRPWNHPWQGTFTVDFFNTDKMNQGIDVAVSVLPPHTGYQLLFSKNYHVRPAPHQAVSPPAPGKSSPVPSYFGS